MSDVRTKNFLRFSSYALAFVGFVMGGPEKALSFPISDSTSSTESRLKSHTQESILNPSFGASNSESSFNSESDNQLIASGKFGGVSSSIGSNSNSLSENSLADSSSVDNSKSYSGGSNPASYYWYRRNKNKNVTPSTIKAAFTKRSNSFSTKFSETLSGIDTSSSTVSETLDSTISPVSSSIISGLEPNMSALSSSPFESNIESAAGTSLLTSSFSQSF